MSEVPTRPAKVIKLNMINLVVVTIKSQMSLLQPRGKMELNLTVLLKCLVLVALPRPLHIILDNHMDSTLFMEECHL